MELPDLIARAYAQSEPNPYLFRVGQVVRLRKGRSDDGQTPEYWDGTKATVVSRYSTGIHKVHWYKLRHLENGRQAEFEEDELDARCRRL